ncbi:MAG TPA: response regulator [Xanthomonadales bacterium]|nr:response regulator [Xanthomonadales bacterium]
MRDSLRILLFTGGYHTCSFESADAWLEATETPDVDVYLLDLRMPGTDGMELHRLMLEQGSKVPVIFITGHGDIPMAVTAIQRGAADFLTKPFEEGELLEKIEFAIGKFRAWKSEMDETQAVKQRLEGLTPREQDVLGLIVKGYSNKQAAAKLDISPRTVEIHRARVMEKTGADSIATLVRMATQLDASEEQ